MKYLVFPLTLLLSVLFSCEDTFEIDSRFETPQIVVDAWLTDQPVPQTITLTVTQDYFDPSRPGGLADGTVSVCRTTDDTCFTFTHTTEGRYVWTPAPGQTIGTVGDAFELTIQRGEETYTAQSSLRRVPPIDSISVQFEDGLGPGAEDGLYSQLYARDFPGTGDTYWIRTTINDTLLNRPEEILLAYDATFDAGTATDGIAFIFPIRFGINRENEDGDLIPFVTGDSIAVDLLAINPIAFQFLQIAQEQILLGDSGIFAPPSANSPSNIFRQSDGKTILGIFNVSSVSSAVKVVEE